MFQWWCLCEWELDGKTALIGFAGAPYTMASYMIEGRPTKDFGLSKGLMYGQPEAWRRLMETLTEVTIRYLSAQVHAGVQVVQLFDSWMGSLGRREYEENVLPYSRRIFEAINALGVPTIHFGTDTAGLLEQMTAAGSGIVSVDWRIPLDEAVRRVEPGKALQGNLDPAVLLAPWDVVEERALDVLGRGRTAEGHVFNLGHGVLPETDPGILARLADLVHAESIRTEA